MIFSILELVTCLKLGGGGTARVAHEPRGHEERKFGNHCFRYSKSHYSDTKLY